MCPPRDNYIPPSGVEHLRQQRCAGVASRDGSPIQDVEPQHARLLIARTAQDHDREQEIQDYGRHRVPEGV